MIINYKINNNIEINTVNDLFKLNPLIENGLKINKSDIARKLNIDRRTVDKYINGFVKSKTKKKKAKSDEFYDLIKALLDNNKKVFAYKRILWQYLVDNHGLNIPESSFRRYISKHKEFNDYFKKHSSSKALPTVRFETQYGKQAQLDWKESMDLVLYTGEIVTINVMVLLLSNSRFRVYRVSLTKSQEVLFNFLDETFEIFGGVPSEILTDNMKTVMDTARTSSSPGKINNKFHQFAKDYGFKVKPCVAASPRTKGKVESPMRILEEIKAYNGELSYEGVVKKINEINERENNRFHKGYNTIPIKALENEKDFLLPLPHDKVRNHYRIATKTVKVNKSSMISYKTNMYSVPQEYINKILTLQVYDSQIHLYYNKILVAIHEISSRKINYLDEHYISLLKNNIHCRDEDIVSMAKKNMHDIGAKYR